MRFETVDAAFHLAFSDSNCQISGYAKVLTDHFQIEFFNCLHHRTHQTVVKLYLKDIFHNPAYNIRCPKSFGRALPVCLDQTGCTQQGAPKIPDHYHKNIGEFKGVDLSQNRATCRTTRFSIVIGPVLLPVQTQSPGKTMMPRFIMRLFYFGQAFLPVFFRIYRKGISVKLTSLILEEPFGWSSDCMIGIWGQWVSFSVPR